MFKPVRVAAGLGDPLSEFCTINSALKQFLGFKKNEWPVFNEKINEFVLEQEKEADKCILGIGQYSLLEGYEHLKVSSAKWFTAFNKEQKANVLCKFHTASVDDIIVAPRVYLSSLFSPFFTFPLPVHAQ